MEQARERRQNPSLGEPALVGEAGDGVEQPAVEVVPLVDGHAGHLDVEAGVGGGRTVVGGPPVRDDEPLEPPLGLEHVREESPVFGGVDAVDPVVGGHDRTHPGLADRGLEGAEVELSEGALVDLGGDGVAVGLLVVGDEVFRGGHHAGVLDGLDDGDGEPGGQVWVLAEVLEGTATGRCADDVAAGREDGVVTRGADLGRERPPERPREVGVPGGSECHRRGERRGGDRADPHRPVDQRERGYPGPLVWREVAGRPAAGVRCAAELVHLLCGGERVDQLRETVGVAFELALAHR
jgi:hypothetical protein